MIRIFHIPSVVFMALALISIASPSRAADAGRQYVIYFREDSTLVDGYSDVIKAAGATHETFCPQQQINLLASTDTIGTNAENIQRSKNYARIVTDQLVEFGVDKSLIIVSATGETRLPVPTKDNTAEPENRRVTITFGDGTDPYMCGLVVD